MPDSTFKNQFEILHVQTGTTRAPASIWQIPFSKVERRAEYEQALKLCHKYQKPYPEALELLKKEGAAQPASRDGVSDEKQDTLPLPADTKVSETRQPTNPKVEKSSQGQTQKKSGRGSVSKWLIPFHYQHQKKEYNEAYALCRKYNLSYPEALKKDAINSEPVILEGSEWQKDELQVIEREERGPEAWALYRKMFPKSERTKAAVLAKHKQFRQEREKAQAAEKNTEPKPVLDNQGEPLFTGAFVQQAVPYEKTIKPGTGRILEISVEGVCRVGPPISKSLPAYCLKFHKKEEEAVKPPERQPETNGTQIGGVVLPDVLKPIEERRAFQVKDRVIQVAGKPPLHKDPGEIIRIRGNDAFVIEFYDEQLTLRREEIALYQHPGNKKATQEATAK
jgi:hypothetical protein